MDYKKLTLAKWKTCKTVCHINITDGTRELMECYFCELHNSDPTKITYKRKPKKHSQQLHAIPRKENK